MHPWQSRTKDRGIVEQPIAILLDPAKTKSGRSRFFCDLAGILRGLGYSVGFGYPGSAVQRREYPYPPEVFERTLERRSTTPDGGEGWLKWVPAKSHVITRRSLFAAIHDAALVIVPATVDAEIGAAIRSAPEFAGRLLLTDHTGSRLTTGTAEGRPLESYRAWMDLADGVHTVNDGLAEIARRYGARRVFTIPPAIDNRAFVSRWRVGFERLLPRRRAILVPGALSESKGCVTMLRAFAGVSARYPSWRMEFFGEGPERSTMETLIREWKLGDVVRLRGFDPDLVTRYRGYPIVASATAFEAFPLVLTEAMASGCIAVFPATSGGPAAIIGNGNNGLLAQTDNEADVAVALMDAIERFESRSGSWREMQAQAMKSAQVAKHSTVTEAWRAQLGALGCGAE